MTAIVSSELDNLRLRVAAYRAEYQAGSDKWPFRCCELALSALEAGNYGVGAVLIDQDGNLLAESGNQVFSPQFDSSAHAEMKVLDYFEAKFPHYTQRKLLTLYVSLEPCPMCCARIFTAGIGRLVFMNKDQNGGMILRRNKLPNAWVNISQLVDIKEYKNKNEIKILAKDIASAQKDTLRRKLMAIIRP